MPSFAPRAHAAASTRIAVATVLLLAFTAPALRASPIAEPSSIPCSGDILAVGDFVWSDLNGNGMQDPGEPGVEGVVMDLEDGNGHWLAEVLTDATGHYEFGDLSPGTYRVVIKPPCGLTITHAGGNRDIDSDANPTTVTITNSCNGSIDFGLVCPPTQSSCACTLGYPDHSNDPRSSVVFNESTVLRASDPGDLTCAAVGGTIKVWYNDEHALSLGIRQVQVKTASGTTSTNYAIAPTPASPGSVSHPPVGSTITSGPQAGNDVAAGGGRPIWPALFITDLTLNGPTSRAGDWQQGGTGIAPSAVYGTWKSAVRVIDTTHNPPVVKIVVDKDPAKNNWNLGAGADTPPNGFKSLKNEGYGAEVVWNISELGLDPSHSYRLQFMVHDGDQNKSGGDVGETCTILPAAIGLSGAVAPAAQSIAAPGVQLAPTPEIADSRAIPNPFRETMRYAYRTTHEAAVDVSVFDLAGRHVRTLAAGAESAGEHSVTWDGRGDDGAQLTRGVYFLRARVGGEQKTTRIMYLR